MNVAQTELLISVMVTFLTILVHVTNLARNQLIAYMVNTVVLGLATIYISYEEFTEGILDAPKSVEFYLIAIITIALKGILIPFIILRALNRMNFQEEPKAFAVSITRTVFVSCLLIILAFAIIEPVLTAMSDLHSTIITILLPASFGITLMGFYMLATGKKIYTQIIALLVMENGIYFATVATTFGMPMLLEVGILFDIIASVMIMVLFLLVILRDMKSMEAKNLEELTE
jgi:hydrogenase-4 component E